MEYTSTLEGLEDVSIALASCYEHQVEAWAILFPLVKGRVSYEFLIVVSKAPSSLSVNYEACQMDGLHE